MYTLFGFSLLTNSKIKLLEFLWQHGVLPRTRNCQRCGRKLLLNIENLYFKCNHSYLVSHKPKKKWRKCGYKESGKKGTFFENTKLSIITVSRLVAIFLLMDPPRQEFTSIELNLSSKTVVDWFSFCREVCIFWAEKYSQKLGGPGKIVEIDEVKIDKRKYNRGPLIREEWVFSGFERGSKKVFLFPVTDRTQDTLLECIEKWILPGTTIMSDCWKSYNCLSHEGFQHLTVNHSYNFVDPVTGAHTQIIERTRRDVRSKISKYETKSDHYLGYLCTFRFKKFFPEIEQIEKFFSLIGEMYPPRSGEGDPSGGPSTSS